MANCRSCGKVITWAQTDAGKQMPLELAVADGDWVILRPRTVSGGSMAVHIQDRDDGLNAEIAQEVRSGRRFKSHFATCPEADKWRRS